MTSNPLSIIREQLRLAGFTDPDRVLNSYPHELSGGMLQRVCIVMALLPKPKLIIADEPTTALDVTVQAQVLAVLKDMAEKTGTAVLLITHNMGIVSQYAHRVAVMYAGTIIEYGTVREVFRHPLHPYTKGLLGAIPTLDDDKESLTKQAEKAIEKTVEVVKETVEKTVETVEKTVGVVKETLTPAKEEKNAEDAAPETEDAAVEPVETAEAERPEEKGEEQ